MFEEVAKYHAEKVKAFFFRKSKAIRFINEVIIPTLGSEGDITFWKEVINKIRK